MVFMNDRAKRPSLLPDEVEAWMQRWSRRLLGAALLSATGLIWVALASWSAHDPALQGAPIADNVLGLPGAITGDLLFQSFGLVAVLLLIPPVMVGIDLCRMQSVPKWRKRLLLWPVAGVLLAGLAAVVPVPSQWPIPHGLGGLVGDLVFQLVRGFLATVSPHSALPLAAAGFAVPAVFAFAHALGFRAIDFVVLFQMGRRTPRETVSSDGSNGTATRYWSRPFGRSVTAGRAPVRSRQSDINAHREPETRQPANPRHNSSRVNDAATVAADAPVEMVGATASESADPSPAFLRHNGQKTGDVTIGRSGRIEPVLPDAPAQLLTPTSNAATDAPAEQSKTSANARDLPAFMRRDAPLSVAEPELPFADEGDSAAATGVDRDQPSDVGSANGVTPQVSPATAAATTSQLVNATRARIEPKPAAAATDVWHVQLASNRQDWGSKPGLEVGAPPQNPHPQATMPLTPERPAAAVVRIDSSDICEVLSDFGIDSRVVDDIKGPVVTQLTLDLAPGVKPTRLEALRADIARALRVPSIRVAAREKHGRRCVVVEVPHETAADVALKPLLEDAPIAPQWRLPVVLGQSVDGSPCAFDLTTMPQLLVGGDPSAGIGRALQAAFATLATQRSAAEVQMVLAGVATDVFAGYDETTHLMSPVLQRSDDALAALAWLADEADKRRNRFADSDTLDIESHNARAEAAGPNGEALRRTVQTGFDPRTGAPTFETRVCHISAMPRIVMIIDELSTLLRAGGLAFDRVVERLGSHGGVAGIHVVAGIRRFGPQDWSATFQEAFPARIAVATELRHPSQLLIGDDTATQLLGGGDAVFATPGLGVLRTHLGGLSTQERDGLVQHLASLGPVQDHEPLISAIRANRKVGQTETT